jgi:hypothetical protein
LLWCRLRICARTRTAQRIESLVLGLDEGGEFDAGRGVAVVASVLNVEDGLVGVGEGLVERAFALVFVTLLINGELHNIDNVRDKIDRVLEADGEVVGGGGGGEEFDVVDVGRFVVAEAVLVIALCVLLAVF